VRRDPLRTALSSALVALDFDGTLAPISPHPDDARPQPGADQILRDVRATGATVAVVSGRSVASLLRVSGFGAIRSYVAAAADPPEPADSAAVAKG
jgi:trehalose-phosphatase